MGTSNVRNTPHRRRQKGGGGGDTGVGSTQWFEDTGQKVDAIMKTVLPLLPDGSAKTPIYVAGSEAIFFAYQWHKGGLDNAIRESGRRIAKQYVVPFLVNDSWNRISKNITPGPLSGITQKAYERTMSEIFNKGVDALADYKRAG